MDSISKQLISSVANTEVVGQALLTAVSGTWICPPGVTSVSVVVIAAGSNYVVHGGSLRYRNNIPVVPGNSYSYENPAPSSINALAWFISSFTVSARTGYGNAYNTGITQYGDGGGNGGVPGSNSYGQGGCGAGGYSGNGGVGGSSDNLPTPGNGGGGGGGGWSNGGGPSGYNGYNGGGGGGVGPYGAGSSGSAGAYKAYSSGPATGGGAGSSGAPGSSSGDGAGGLYGGGAGYLNAYSPSDGYPSKPMYGGYGCIRIIWPGNQRQFPSTRTADE